MKVLLTLVLLVCTGQAVVRSAPPSMLQQVSSDTAAAALSNYLARYSTPEGQIAAGLELVNDNLVATSDQITDEANLLLEKLRRAVQLIGDAVSAILQDEIFQREAQLTHYRNEIQEVLIQINDASGVCEQYPGCLACIQDQACVWCGSLGRCTTGDDLGPLNGECEDFYYRECPARNCTDYTSCLECLTDSACEWCVGSAECADTGETECDPAFLVTELSGGSCPVTDEQLLSSYSTDTPLNIPDMRLPALESQLLDLEAQAARLRDEINLLGNSLSLIEDSQRDAQNIVLSGNYTFEDMQGLANSVEELAVSEEQTRRDAMGQAVSDAANTVSSRILDYVQQSNAQRLQDVQGQSQSIVDLQTQTLNSLSGSAE